MQVPAQLDLVKRKEFMVSHEIKSETQELKVTELLDQINRQGEPNLCNHKCKLWIILQAVMGFELLVA